MMTPVARACVIAVLAPLCVAAAGMAWVAGAERAGFSPFAGVIARNSAEAAALGRASEVLRLLRQGEDPRQVYPVRPDIISSAVRRATTLEAAIWSRQAELVELLDAHDAIGAGDRDALACLAVDLQVEDIVEYLAPGGTTHCEQGKAMARVIARTTETGDAHD